MFDRTSIRLPQLVLVAVATLTGCGLGSAPPLSPTASPSPSATASASPAGSLVIVGRIITMGEPPEAEALLIERGVVAAVGSRKEVLALAGLAVPVIDMGHNVAYPGFIDAHAHWIGDRGLYGADSVEAAMNAALSRGWTSISEQWVDEKRLAELEALAADGPLPIRVDAYLALNPPPARGEHLAAWYADRKPGLVTDHLRVQGVKIGVEKTSPSIFNWEPAELIAAIGRANDAGWQVSVHTVSTEAHDMVLDAFVAAIGPDGPNPRHHRLEHVVQVTDGQLTRMIAMDLGTVVHLDGVVVVDTFVADFDHAGPDRHGEELGWLERWRDFVEGGLHVAAGSDGPWILYDLQLTDDIGRPIDQIAGGMDGRGRANPETPVWAMAQLLTAEQALRAVTVDAAWVLADEGRRGLLAPGTLGDVTILSGDVLDATPDEIRDFDVVATIVGGEVVHCSAVAICGGD